MTSEPGRRLKTLAMIVVMVTASPLGYAFVSKGMQRIGWHGWAPADVLRFFVEAFTSPTIWLGIGLLLAFFVAFLLVLSWADYSYVQPAGSFSYAVIALLAQFMLHESVSPTRWAGVIIICLGVLVVGRTQVKTTEGPL